MNLLLQRITVWLSENLSRGTKICLAMLGAFFFCAGFSYFSIFIVGEDLYMLMNNADSVFYSGKSIFALAQTPILIISYPIMILSYLESRKFIKKTKITNGIMATLCTICAIWFVLAFIASFIITPVVTDYVNAHYTPCEKHTGLFSGTVYVKGNAVCTH
ncbi:DUF1240 domain-containing protein [Salmonella enterica]|nr:DUF1240 domain-containing protein [Salmonella enterica]EKT1325608.1 DUF1240 domain-containing protein [Salmonella enterica]EKT1358743.1 DUF1240 domain-containing protein [Salmonella enterica]EKT2634777.1 DUF1240 domain-containing protein [Salmonella enterica]EKT3223714.1 DUF1240 domain-containing protein [Salmonella enterica]